MRDADVRRVLIQHLHTCYGTDADTLIVEELGLCRGSVRADVAVVNGILKGYEIKSDRDTLTRLAGQAEAYNRIFDTVTIVVAARHLENVERVVPNWWGIQTVSLNSDSILKLTQAREEAHNNQIDPAALAQLLWRDEVIFLLENVPVPTNFERKPREFLWRTLVESVHLVELKALVRECLRRRKFWRGPAERMRCGETCPLCATLSGFPSRPSGSRSRRYTHRPS